MKATKGNRCDSHAKDYEERRGTRQARGYDRKHDAERRLWEPKVAGGSVSCWRCGDPIVAGSEWDLGHGDDGRIVGPEHAGGCNRRAAALKGHGKPWTPGGGSGQGQNPSRPAPPAPLSADLRAARVMAQERAAKAVERRQRRLAAREAESDER